MFSNTVMANFSHDEYLIAKISCQKELFDKSNKYYRDLEMKESIWESIGTEIHMDVNSLKKRWKNLRDTYIKKKKEQRARSVDVGKASKEWKYLKSMEFLGPYVEFTFTTANSPDILDTEDIDGFTVEDTTHVTKADVMAHSIVVVPDIKESPTDVSSFTVGTPKAAIHGKRKAGETVAEQSLEYVREMKTRNQSEMTGEEHFALSLVPALRRMGDRQRSMAKLRIQQVLFEVEFNAD